MTTPRTLILASASPRRLELLRQIGIDPQVIPAEIEERCAPGETPEAYVRRVAAEKSLEITRHEASDLTILAADTEVVLDGEIFGKPRDFEHGAAMLKRLSGREHQVLSAVSLRHRGRHWEALSVSTVAFRELSDSEIAAYWVSGEPLGKAGAYAIQGLGATFIRHLSGSYSGVMGLPLFETAQLLAEIGLPIPAPTGQNGHE